MRTKTGTLSVKALTEGLGIQWQEVPFSDGLVFRFGSTFVKSGQTGYLVARQDRKLPLLCVNIGDLVRNLDDLGLPTNLRPVRHVG